MNERHEVDAINLGFAKAFGSVYHSFLLAKMQFFSLFDVIVRWIEAHLSGRVTRVHVDELTGTISMRSGVSQSSVIGPLLFLLCVKFGLKPFSISLFV